MKGNKNKTFLGFALIELLVVVAIIGFLASVALVSLNRTRAKAYYARAAKETVELSKALNFYLDAHGSFPADVDRSLPPGLEVYLPSGDWPNAPWPGSVYDWDNWADPNNPSQNIYQISIRFCPIGGPISSCKFPLEEWAQDFQVNSAVYYCLSGSCRSHISEPLGFPGKCINCGN
ncbi:MAG TPA: prepilin-type N-terminal cleavage/methylation domain-containing protein [Verrucomicrobiae bacterium]|nr:prepilin-type N-terminal cleavage/methylation domain-containing protein [Verrucomicrobiae bacterium]